MKIQWKFNKNLIKFNENSIKFNAKSMQNQWKLLGTPEQKQLFSKIKKNNWFCSENVPKSDDFGPKVSFSKGSHRVYSRPRAVIRPGVGATQPFAADHLRSQAIWRQKKQQWSAMSSQWRESSCTAMYTTSFLGRAGSTRSTLKRSLYMSKKDFASCGQRTMVPTTNIESLDLTKS